MTEWKRVISQNAENVFRIAFRILGSEHDAEDVKTQLPVRSRKRRSRSADGLGWTGGFVEGVYSFPESGPKDIYDLGVPRDAKIVRTSYWGAGAAEITDRSD